MIVERRGRRGFLLERGLSNTGKGAPRADGWLDAHLAYLPARAGARILDLGCGRGANAACLAQKGYNVVACDVSRVALGQVAHDACAGQIVCLDMRDALPFGDEAFAAIVADLSLHYFLMRRAARWMGLAL